MSEAESQEIAKENAEISDEPKTGAEATEFRESEFVIDGNEFYNGLVRNKKDAQRLHNMSASELAEKQRHDIAVAI